MKVSENWLREWIDPPLPGDELAEQLTLMGLEVDTIEDAHPGFTDVVVGRVQSAVKHPNADSLRLCQVDAGLEEPLSIVCGAPNAREGLVAPVAVVGARLPGGHKIRKSKIRGEVSMGMLCSSAELGLAADADGLLELPDDAPVGESLADYLKLDDHILEVELTPNRGDCLSIRGVARDISARNDLPIVEPVIDDSPVVSDQTWPFAVDAGTACVRYSGRVVDGIDGRRSSPLWLTEKLRRCGVRAISPAVDVTNFVMLSWGQPMHAFDLDKVKGDIRVRMAKQGEQITLLDGRDIALDDDVTVIADDAGAIGVAGIMGGQRTAVDQGTTRIFFESALFLPEGVAGRAWRLDAHTDSSHRFERGVDPGLQVEALEYATSLLIHLCGGQAGPVSDWTEDARMPIGSPITLRREKITSLLGTGVADESVESILGRLGVDLRPAEGGWQVTPPTHRYDLRIEEDYIEELARINGFDTIPRHHGSMRPGFEAVDETHVSVDTLKRALVARGYQEIVSFSFVDNSIQQALDSNRPALAVSNPISMDMSVMRNTLSVGLLGAARHNLHRQQPDLRLFETGLVFVPDGDELVQQNRLGCLITGRRHPENWDISGSDVDFYDLKGDLETLFGIVNGVDWSLNPQSARPFLHPGVSADIKVNGENCGWIGQLHPHLQKSLDMSQTVLMCELALDPLDQSLLPKYQEISKYPSVRRDISILVDEKIPVEALTACIWANRPQWLQKIVVFDLYSGDKIDKGMKSVAFGLILQDFSRTLEESELESAVQGIVSHLNQELGAILRG